MPSRKRQSALRGKVRFGEPPKPGRRDQRFVYNEHVVVSVMQFDDSRVLHARAEALNCAVYPLRERLNVAIEFLLDQYPLLRGKPTRSVEWRAPRLPGAHTLMLPRTCVRSGSTGQDPDTSSRANGIEEEQEVRRV